MGGIRLEETTKVYPNGVKAIDAIDLDIRDGEFMVLVGPSGCGKSTLLRMIAGLEEVTEGRILIGGEDVTRATAARPRHRDGVPELRALPAHERRREPRLRAQAAPDPEAGAAEPRSATSRDRSG